MADIDKIKIDELQDVTGGVVNAEVGSGTELDSTDTEVKKSSPVFCYPALSILVKLVDRYYRNRHYLSLSSLSIGIIEKRILDTRQVILSSSAEKT